MTRQILHLFAEGEQVCLPFISDLIKCTVLYVHVEFETNTAKDTVKLSCNFISICNNFQSILCAFHLPPRVRDITYEPRFREPYDVVEKYSDLYLRIVTGNSNTVKKVYVRLEVEQA